MARFELQWRQSNTLLHWEIDSKQIFRIIDATFGEWIRER